MSAAGSQRGSQAGGSQYGSVAPESPEIKGKYMNFTSQLAGSDPCMGCVAHAVDNYEPKDERPLNIRCRFVPGSSRCERCANAGKNTSCFPAPGLMVGDYHDFVALAEWARALINRSWEDGNDRWQYYAPSFRAAVANSVRNVGLTLVSCANRHRSRFGLVGTLAQTQGATQTYNALVESRRKALAESFGIMPKTGVHVIAAWRSRTAPRLSPGDFGYPALAAARAGFVAELRAQSTKGLIDDDCPDYQPPPPPAAVVDALLANLPESFRG